MQTETQGLFEYRPLEYFSMLSRMLVRDRYSTFLLLGV